MCGTSKNECNLTASKPCDGTHVIMQAVYKAGRHVNDRRNMMRLNDCPLRVGNHWIYKCGEGELFALVYGKDLLR